MSGGKIRGFGSGTAVNIGARGKFTKSGASTTIYGNTNPDSDGGGACKNQKGIVDLTFEGTGTVTTETSSLRTYAEGGITYTEVNNLLYSPLAATPPANPAKAVALTATVNDKAVVVTVAGTGGALITAQTTTAANGMIVATTTGDVIAGAGNVFTTVSTDGPVALMKMNAAIPATSMIVVVKSAMWATQTSSTTIAATSGLMLVGKQMATTQTIVVFTAGGSTPTYILKNPSLVVGTDLIFYGPNKTLLGNTAYNTTATTFTITKSTALTTGTATAGTASTFDYMLLKQSAYTARPLTSPTETLNWTT
jgi:hypothetical protein